MTTSGLSRDQLKRLSPKALFALGAQDIAYVKPGLHEGQPVQMVYTADGNQIGTFADREVAFAACRQHDLEPVSVH